MALKEWKNKYYPIDVLDLPRNDDGMIDNVTAIEHSILKWSGLMPELLEKYGLMKEHKRIVEIPRNYPDEFEITDITCALCYNYIDDCCELCPLNKIGDCCYSLLENSYMTWNESGDPTFMIESLRKCLDIELNKSN